MVQSICRATLNRRANENFAFIKVIAISLFIIQLSFAWSPAFYFRKNLWAHISFYSTCFWYYRIHPHNDNKICLLPSSAETTSWKILRKYKTCTLVCWSLFEKEAKVPFNLFHATSLFLKPLKTSENLWFSDVFRVYGKRPVAWNMLINCSFKIDLALLELYTQDQCISGLVYSDSGS